MSTSPVKISNLALYKLGETQRISTWPDESDNGELCYEFFVPVLEHVLESEDWQCVMSRARLARSSETPAFAYEYQYALPNDCLRPVCICDVSGIPLDTDWEVGFDPVQKVRVLLTNEDEVYIKYIYRLVDLSKLTPTLVRVLYLNLAIELAVPLMKHARILEALHKELELVVLPAALAANAKVGYVEDEAAEDLATEVGR